MTLRSPDHPYRNIPPSESAPIMANSNAITHTPALSLYPLIVGLLMGFIQSGLFFQLTFTLSSTYSTFLMVTICWLVGSALGTLYLAKQDIRLNLFLGLALAAYAACGALLLVAPFNTSLAPLYALLIVATGFYPGVFFARTAPYYRAHTLFSRENNGFIMGLVVATMLFMVAGRIVLWVLPVVTAAIVFYLESRLNWRDVERPSDVKL